MTNTRMQELGETYLAIRKNQGKGESTIRGDRRAVMDLARVHDKANRVPKSLDRSWLERYLYGPEGVVASGRMQPNSFNILLVQLRQFLVWGVQEGALRPEALSALKRLPETEPERMWMSLDDVVTMIEKCEDEWERFALTLASQTLCRDGEMCTLKLGDFDLDGGEVEIVRHKTRQEDVITVTEVLAEALDRWLSFVERDTGLARDNSWYVVPRRRIYRVPDADVQDYCHVWHYDPGLPTVRLGRIVKKHAAKQLGVEPDSLGRVGMHMIRRSMARAFYEQLIQQGHQDPIRVVMAMLGHKDQRITEIYLGIKADRLRRNQILRRNGRMLWTTTN